MCLKNNYQIAVWERNSKLIIDSSKCIRFKNKYCQQENILPKCDISKTWILFPGVPAKK